MKNLPLELRRRLLLQIKNSEEEATHYLVIGDEDDFWSCGTETQCRAEQERLLKKGRNVRLRRMPPTPDPEEVSRYNLEHPFTF